MRKDLLRVRVLRSLLIAIAALSPAAGSLSAAMTVSLEPSFPAPVMVGDTVIWQATVTDAAPGVMWYRFRVRGPSGDFHTVIDFAPRATYAWSPVEREGMYEIEVTARHRDNGESATASVVYSAASRVNDGVPAVSPTFHPLVYLYSAPACPREARMRVEFGSGAGDLVTTPEKACNGDTSMNFLLAGMRPGYEYTIRHVIDGPREMTLGQPLVFLAPEVPLDLGKFQVTRAPKPEKAREILLQSNTLSQKAVATDLEGNLLWFYPGTLNNLTRVRAGGIFLGIAPTPSSVREFDLTGTTLRETSFGRVNEQLTAMGKRNIVNFHHEAEFLPDGRIVAIASNQQVLTDVQGPGPATITGDMIIVFGPEMQVEWVWDAFDHLDPRRAAILNEPCAAGQPCPVRDWLHSNSVRRTPDGHLLLSVRHQDWLLKIDYADGRGCGRVLWRLGREGDFRIVSDDPDPWFSHQHDATILPGPEMLLTVFDNGNIRYQYDGEAHSRGQVYKLDEENRTATLIYNADLGAYSQALGSAQRLPDGNYHFDAGWLSSTSGKSVETDAEGRIIYEFMVDSTAYRTIRMRDLYTPW